jgi:hypothetical protein
VIASVYELHEVVELSKFLSFELDLRERDLIYENVLTYEPKFENLECTLEIEWNRSRCQAAYNLLRTNDIRTHFV